MTHTLIGVIDSDNDLLDLFINPDATDFWNPANGSNSADASLLYLSNNSSSAARPGSGASVTWDDLVLATTAAEVRLLENCDNVPNIIGVENSDYADGPVGGQSGGTHWDFDNSTENDAFFGHTGTLSDWDVFSGAPLLVGGILTTQDSSAKREFNGPLEGVQDGSDERFGTERYLFGVPGAANPVSGQREFAIHDLNPNNHAYSGILPVAGQSYTLVAKLDYESNIAALQSQAEP